MNDRDWASFCFLLDSAFKGELDEAGEAAYRALLGHHDAEALTGAVRKLVEDGQVWLPKPGEIAAALSQVREDPVPSWSEVWAAMQRAFTRRTPGEAFVLMEKVHPIAAVFYDNEGHAKLTHIEFWDPKYGGLRVKELRERWEAFVEVAVERLSRGRALAAATGRGELAPASLSVAALAAGIKPRTEIGPGDGS